MMVGIAAGFIAIIAFVMGYVMADIGIELARDEGWEEGVRDVIRLLPAELVEQLTELEEEMLNE